MCEGLLNGAVLMVPAEITNLLGSLASQIPLAQQRRLSKGRTLAGVCAACSHVLADNTAAARSPNTGAYKLLSDSLHWP